MRSLVWRLRAAALVLAGSMVVHELRYLLAYDGAAGRVLSSQGHAYLVVLAPVAAALVALGLAEFCWRLARPRAPHLPEQPPGFAPCWVFASGALVAIYLMQEFLEGLLEAGHPAGVAGVFGHGGWLALPLAIAVGAAIAFLLRGAAIVLRAAARRARLLFPRAARVLAPSPRPACFPRLAPLALRSAGRAPPFASVH